MAGAEELRHLCLLAAANGLAQDSHKRANSSRRVRYSMRCVLYMLVAFSLRRRNLARRDLRTPPSNPNVPNSSRLRFSGYIAAAFRAKMRSRLASFPSVLPHKQGCLAITYM